MRLKKEDIAMKIEGDILKEVEIKQIRIIKKKQKTFNLSNVKDNHDFFANGILVHNKS